MNDWVSVGKASEFEAGQGKSVVVGDRRVALFRDGNDYFAIDDTCPHQGASLGEGMFHDGRVICPWHSWIFEVRTGQCPRNSHEGVRSYPTRCTNGDIEVQLA